MSDIISTADLIADIQRRLDIRKTSITDWNTCEELTELLLERLRADRQSTAEGTREAMRVAALVALTRAGMTTDIATVLAQGDPARSLAPLVIDKMIEAALRVCAPPSPGQGVDWQFAALRETVARLPPSPDDSAFGPLSGTHLQDMLSRVEGDPSSFSRAKLGRWLGWAQCAVVARARGTLDDMKEINRQHSRASPRKDAGAYIRDSASREVRSLELTDWLEKRIGTGWECSRCGHTTYHTNGFECEECGEVMPLEHELAFKLHATHSADEVAIDRQLALWGRNVTPLRKDAGAAPAKPDGLRAASINLRDHIAAIWSGHFEADIRAAIGNTNWAVIDQAISTFNAALSATAEEKNDG